LRSEVLLLKSQTSAKGKEEIDLLLKSQNEQQKGKYFYDFVDQLSNKNVVINTLKGEKRKMGQKVSHLDKQLIELESTHRVSILSIDYQHCHYAFLY
jgi:hypothetical protein